MKEKNKLEKLKPKGIKLKKIGMLLVAFLMVFQSFAIGVYAEERRVTTQFLSTIVTGTGTSNQSKFKQGHWQDSVTGADVFCADPDVDGAKQGIKTIANLTGYRGLASSHVDRIGLGIQYIEDNYQNLSKSNRAMMQQAYLWDSMYLYGNFPSGYKSYTSIPGVMSLSQLNSVIANARAYADANTKDYEVVGTLYLSKAGEQNMASFSVKKIERKGKLKLKKATASNKHLTDLCPENYTLIGATYGVYSDSELSTKVGELTVADKLGNSNVLELDANRYWITELVAPKGYKLDKGTYYIDVVAEQENIFNATDEPLFDPLSLVIRKQAQDGADKNLSLKGAEYKVSYYKEGKEVTKDTVNNYTPFRTWIFATDENGEIYLFDEWKVGGDELFKKENGVPVGLDGAYVFEEVKAPKGFAKTDGIIDIQYVEAGKNTDDVEVLKDVLDVEKEQTISLTIQKKDSQTMESKAQGYGSLEGAKYEVSVWDAFESIFKKVAEVVTDVTGKAMYEGGKPGVYKVKELEASRGYIVDEAIKEIKAGIREINTANFNYDVESLEDVTQIEFSKTTVDENGNKIHLAGAVIELIDNTTGQVIETFTTTSEPKVIKGLSIKGNYTFREVEAPKGYFKAEDLTFTVKDTKEVQKQEMFDEPMGEVELTKLIEEVNSDFSLIDKENIDYTKIKFDLYKADGTKVGEYSLDEKGMLKVGKLRAGDYYFMETETLSNLVLNKEKIPFTISLDKENFNLKAKVSVENKITKLKVSKTDVTGDKELPGAKLTIIDKETGKEITNFISKEEPTYITGLLKGKTYILKEEIAPKGFVLSKSEVEFTVNEDGSITTATMINKVYAVDKVDIDGRKVIGAEFEILDKEANVVDTFTSTEENYHTSNLVEGEAYILHEVKAPKGFVLMKDIEFTVSEEKEDEVLKVLNKQVHFKKLDEDGVLLAGAKMQVLDKESNVVDEFITTNEIYAIRGLKEDEEYILREIEAPEGYEKAEDIHFSISRDENGKLIDMVDKRKTVNTGDERGIGIVFTMMIISLGMFTLLRNKK